MIEFFELRNGALVITEELLSVASFRAIWDSDKTKKKNSAMDAFLFIYHMYHPKSPYSGYSDTERESAVRKNELSSTLRTSAKLEKAIADFVRLRDSADPLFNLVRSAQGMVYKLSRYYDGIEPGDEEFDIKKITDSLVKMDGLVQSYSSLEEKVRDKLYSTTKTRGNREINLFEQ